MVVVVDNENSTSTVINGHNDMNDRTNNNTNNNNNHTKNDMNDRTNNNNTCEKIQMRTKIKSEK